MTTLVREGDVRRVGGPSVWRTAYHFWHPSESILRQSLMHLRHNYTDTEEMFISDLTHALVSQYGNNNYINSNVYKPK